jgi:DNA-binding transcriptional ArsR family regulator
MPDQLLDRILAEIRDRLDASRAAYEESQRLEAALSALGSGRAPEPSRPRATSRRASRSRARSSARAPHGENLRRIRAFVAERPGATAGEIAAATGIARPTVASTLGKLARAGELEKTTLPSRAVGYRPTDAPADDTPVSEAAATPELTEADPPAADGEPAADEPGPPGAASANGDETGS